MKAAHRSRLPIFFVDGLWRPYSVRVAWVLKFNDESGLFLLGFSPASDADVQSDDLDGLPYPDSQEGRERIHATRLARPKQPSFVFDVFARYGVQCAFCAVDLRQVLTAAHIRPVANYGCDDARNGLVLCALHHVGFDKGFIRVNPTTLAVDVAAETSMAGLGVTRPDLTHLRRMPHIGEIAWRYESYLPHRKRTWAS